MNGGALTAAIAAFFLINVAYGAEGFNFPLGPPGGTGYSPDGIFGGLEYLQRHEYGCGLTYHPGEDWNDNNTGLDAGMNSNDANDPVYAASGGTIEYAKKPDDNWGFIVLIKHTGTFRLPEGGTVSAVWSQYAHLSSVATNPDTGVVWTRSDAVRRGQQIGNVGDLKHGSGKNFHLHFEIRKKSLGAAKFPCEWEKATVQDYYTEPAAFINLNRPNLATPPPGDFADLKVSGISFTSPPTLGVRTTAIASLANVGRTSSGVFNVKWYLNGVQVGYGLHESLAPGQTSNGNVRFDWTPTAGAHRLRFEADVDDHVTESDETNNAIEGTINVPPVL